MVLAESRPGLAAIAALAPQLNEVTDKYMAELRKIEASLVDQRLGIEVDLDESFFQSTARYVNAYDDDQRRVQGHYFLGYGRFGDTWCLLVHYDEKIIYPGDEHNPYQNSEWTRQETKPLLEWRRDIRTKAATAIPALLEKIASEAKSRIEEMQKVIDR